MTDVELLAKCGWLEARGDGAGSCYAVMHVVMNRVKSIGFPKTIHDVIYQTNAFSWTRPTDPQYGLEPSPHDAVWASCLYMSASVISGDSDPVLGAVWYANLKTITPGGWFQKNILDHPEKHPLRIKIGQHSFFL